MKNFEIINFTLYLFLKVYVIFLIIRNNIVVDFTLKFGTTSKHKKWQFASHGL